MVWMMISKVQEKVFLLFDRSFYELDCFLGVEVVEGCEVDRLGNDVIISIQGTGHGVWATLVVTGQGAREAGSAWTHVMGVGNS